MPEEFKPADLSTYQNILNLLKLKLKDGEDPVEAVYKLVRIADGVFEALQPIGANHRRCPGTIIANVEGLQRRYNEDHPLADRYRFLREPKASAPVTLPEERWIVVGMCSYEDVLHGAELEKAIDEAAAAKRYEYDPDGGPLLCYQVGDNDWVAAQNPEQAIAVLAEFSGDWLCEHSDDYEAVLATDSDLDQEWKDEDDHFAVGTLRQWLAEATEPCYLNGVE
jgi:hypothetical protein